MSLILIRRLLLIFLITSFSGLFAQTLYWVGGSGNWNDPEHWSLSSGGSTAYKVPNSSTHVIFDKNSYDGSLVVDLVGKNYLNSIQISDLPVPVVFTGKVFSELHISGDFYIEPAKIKFTASTTLFFNSTSPSYHQVAFGGKEYGGNIYFQSGNWDIHWLTVSDNSVVNFTGGNYKFEDAELNTGNFVSSNNAVKFDIKSTYFNVLNNFDIGPNTIFNTDNLYLKVKKSDNTKFKMAQGTNLGLKTKILDNTSAICQATLTTQNITCFGLCDGKIFLTVDAACIGTSFNLIWSNGGGCPNPTLTTIPGPGSYTITNQCVCAFPFSVLIFDSVPNFIGSGSGPAVLGNSAVQVVTSSVQPRCFGDCNGSINATFLFGIPTYTVVHTKPSLATSTTTGVPTGVAQTYTNLCAGTHTFQIRDQNGCITTSMVTLNQPTPVSPNGTSSSLSCNGICTGGATVSPTGGVAGYTVNWSTGLTVAVGSGGSSSQSTLCAGPVTITVTDTKTCSATFTANISQPPALTVTSTQTNVSCGGACDAKASVTVTGGTPGYTYTWSPVPGGGQGTSLATGLCGTLGQVTANHTVTVQDTKGCSKTATFAITQPPPLTLTPTFTNATCNGTCNGQATAGASGGTPPYTYTWSTGANTQSVTGLCGTVAGTIYSYTVADSQGCSKTQTVSISQPPPFTVTVNSTSVTCFGLCTGSASATIGGGTPGYTLAWTPTVGAGQGTGTVTGLCANNYSLSITDSKNCPGLVTFTITQPTSITPNVTTTSVSCNGVCDGVINSVPSGGTGPYTFTLSSSTTTLTTLPPWNALCAGTYTVRILDANGCVRTQTASILQPNAMTLTINTTSVSCFNQCNASLSGNVIGGTPAYNYTWTTPSTTLTGSNINGQCAGTYTLLVVDSKGCSITQTASIAQPPDITVTLAAASPTCFGQCNGAITSTVTGGTPAYIYSWSSGGATPTILNLCAGNYTLTLTDSKLCQKIATITIIPTPSITISTTATPVTCAGNCNGVATATAVGGNPGYSYSWSSFPIQSTPTATGLCTGNYVVTVTDNKGCVNSQNVFIATPLLLSASITSIVPSCNICIGAATVSVNGGTPAYSYTWTNSVGSTVSNASVAAALCSGNYTVRVMDASGCVTTTTLNVPQTIIVVVATNGATLQCNGGCTGIASANPIGGTPAYTYSWMPTGQITQTAVALCSGVHTVIVTDSKGCSSTATTSFANPPAFTVVTTQTNLPCNGVCNGKISIVASGGTGALTYVWSPGNPTGQGTGTVSNLCAGTYTCVITDANNCTTTRNFTITQPAALTATFSSVSPSTCGGTNGTITATASGGTPVYQYTWTPTGVNSATLNNVGAGTYSLSIRDNAGCTATIITTLSDPLGPTITVTSSSVTCFGSCNGSATVSAAGSGPFSYTWTPSGNTTSVVAGVCSGTISINVRDNNLCTTSQTINIVQPPNFTLNPVATNPKCNSSCDGSITTNAGGGTGPYTYTWTPGGTNSATLSNVCAGNYTVNITDAKNCSYSQTFALTAPSAITLTVTKKDLNCNSVCNGSIGVVASGGTGPYTYTWLPGGGFGGSGLNNIVNLCAGIYTLNVTDFNGCPATVTVQLTQPAALTSTLVSVNATCNGLCNGSATVTAGGGVPTYSYSWTGSGATTSTVNALCAGNYTATVTDANGCTSLQAFTVTSPAAIAVTLTPSSPKCNGACNGSITTVVAGGTPAYTFTWIASGGNVQNPTGLCAGSYTVQITDQNGCPGQAVTTVTNPPAMLANISFTNPTCNGACNGIAISNPVNGTPAYTYSWTSPTQTTQTATNLCAGSTTLTVTDVNSCTVTQVINLVAPPAFTLNPAVAAAACGVCNGSITITTLGGTPAYSYTWTPAVSASSVANNLCAGVYTVNVKDTQGCTTTSLIPLSNSNGPTGATVTFTDVTCNNSCNGVASVTNAVGGTPAYSYSWAVPASTLMPLPNLCAGTYTAKITDNLGCILFVPVTISQPAPLADNSVVSLPLCNGVCNGSIVTGYTGGTAAYTYTWSTGANTSSVTGLCTGSYTLRVTDAKGCLDTVTYQLPGLTSITGNTFAANNNCFGKCTGSLSAVGIAGGTPPYSYNWNNGQTTNPAINLCNGNYFVIITDQQGCFDTLKGNITSPAQITLTSSITQPSCGICNGSATVSAGGGTGPYTYTWSSGPTGTTAGNLCAGVQMITVVDNLGCTQNINVGINNSNGITGEIINTTNITCANSCNGAATVTAVGGTPPISYTWVTPVVFTNTLSGLCAGNYIVQMKDAQNCIRTASIDIKAASAMSVTAFLKAPGCNLNNGSITTTVTGGTPGYTYLWSPGGNTTATLSNVGAGTYTLVVTDNGPCSQTFTYSLSNPTAPTLTFATTDVLCNGSCNGTATITATSGSGPFTFTWSTGGGVNTPSMSTNSNLCNGVITVTVAGTNGCLAVQNFTINQPTALANNLPIIKTPKCNGDCDGSITLVTIGGTLPYTYTWNPAGNTNPLTNLCGGNYTSTVTDAKGCQIVTSHTLINPPLLTVSFTPQNSSCNTQPDGAITTTVNGGIPAYSYTWTGPGSFTSSVASLTTIIAGTYSLTIVDFSGCRKDTSLQIISTITVIANAGKDSVFCQNGTYFLDGTLSTGATVYQWVLLSSGGGTVSVANTSTASVNPSVGTSTYVLIASNGACVSSDTMKVTSNSLPIVDAGPDIYIPILSSTQIGGAPTCATAVSYSWIPALTLDNPNISNPIASNTVSTMYTVTVIDANGCLASDTMHVYIYPQIIIPNGFSPNADGKNDTWMIDNIFQFPDNTVEVYNRWGELLFYSQGYPIPWNGQYKGKELPVGTYYYIINLNHPLFPKPYTGPLTIFR